MKQTLLLSSLATAAVTPSGSAFTCSPCLSPRGSPFPTSLPELSSPSSQRRDVFSVISVESRIIANKLKRKRVVLGTGVSDEDSNGNINNRQSRRSNICEDDVYLLSFDGTLASTSRSRSYLATRAALEVWPSLQSTLLSLGIHPSEFGLELEPGQDIAGDSAFETFEKYSDELMDEDELMNNGSSWLIEKLSALSPVTQHGDTADQMLGCETVLLARLLLEEQLLDQGRSNGRGGKYGGKFHPSSVTFPSGSSESRDESNSGSRPLTVGELYANWSELRHVTRNKYPYLHNSQDTPGLVTKNDPIPKIRQVLIELLTASTPQSMPSGKQSQMQMRAYEKAIASWHPVVYDALFRTISNSKNNNNGKDILRDNVMILLGHEAYIPQTLESFSNLGFSLDLNLFHGDSDSGLASDLRSLQRRYSSAVGDEGTRGCIRVSVTTSDKAWETFRNCVTNQSLLLVVPKTNEEESHSSMIKQILMDVNCGMDDDDDDDDDDAEVALDNIGNKNIHIVHSSLQVLKQCKSFLGEDAPILSHGVRRCILPSSFTNSSPPTTSDNSKITSVSLFLPEWADNVDPSQHNDAEMDPWLNFLPEEQFMETISARIVPPTSQVGAATTSRSTETNAE